MNSISIYFSCNSEVVRTTNEILKKYKNIAAAGEITCYMLEGNSFLLVFG